MGYPGGLSDQQSLPNATAESLKHGYMKILHFNEIHPDQESITRPWMNHIESHPLFESLDETFLNNTQESIIPEESASLISPLQD